MAYEHESIIRAQYLSYLGRKQIEISFAADLVSLDVVPSLIFPVYQHVTKVEIFNENNGGSIVNDTLQKLFAAAQSVIQSTKVRIEARVF
jgi:hypothetical protein